MKVHHGLRIAAVSIVWALVIGIFTLAHGASFQETLEVPQVSEAVDQEDADQEDAKQEDGEQEGGEQEEEAAENDEDKRAFLGVTLDASADGAVINSIVADSAAEEAELEEGDKILTLDGEEVDSHETLVAAIQKHREGDEVEIEIERDGETFTETIELGEYPENQVLNAVPAIGLANNLNNAMPKKNFLQAVKKLDVMWQLQNRIEEMKSVCGISEAQARKLNIAAKAVAKKQVEKWSERMDQFQVWDRGGDDDGGQDEQEVLRIEDIDLKKIDANVLRWVSQDFDGIDNPLTSQKVWKKALKATLDDEQREKLDAAQKKRKARMVAASANLIAREFSDKLQLTEEQEDQLAEMLVKKLEPASQASLFSTNNSYGALQFIASIEGKKLKELLDEKQLKRLRIVMGPYGNAGMWQVDE